MTDPFGMTRLTEALEFYGDPDGYTGHEQSVLVAARAVVEGAPIQWCLQHDQPADVCPNFKIESLRDLHKPCSIVSRLLVDFPQ